MSVLEDAVAGKITDEMRVVAKEEGKTPEFICRGIASGRIVIPRSPYRFTKPVGIGKGLRNKVNASIGTSSDIVDVEMELETARKVRRERAPADSMVCTMCGDYCALKIIKENIDLRK